MRVTLSSIAVFCTDIFVRLKRGWQKRSRDTTTTWQYETLVLYRIRIKIELHVNRIELVPSFLFLFLEIGLITRDLCPAAVWSNRNWRYSNRLHLIRIRESSKLLKIEKNRNSVEHLIGYKISNIIYINSVIIYNRFLF